LPVFAGFYRFFPLSRQKYFLPWQKPNPETQLSTGFRKTRILKNPTQWVFGVYWVLGFYWVFLDKQEKIGKIIQKLKNLG